MPERVTAASRPSGGYLGGKRVTCSQIDETNRFNYRGTEGEHIAGLQQDSPSPGRAERGRYQSLRTGKTGDVVAWRLCRGGCKQQVFVVVQGHVTKIAAV